LAMFAWGCTAETGLSILNATTLMQSSCPSRQAHVPGRLIWKLTVFLSVDCLGGINDNSESDHCKKCRAGPPARLRVRLELQN
jgi:hypothetical protein